MMNRTHAYYGGTQADKNERRYRKLYSSISPVEIIKDHEYNSVKIITYLGGDAYTAPVAHIKIRASYRNRRGRRKIKRQSEYHYLHRDYLGSILAISDSRGAVKERRHFSAWGKAAHFSDANGKRKFTHSALLGRGFTGHEHFFEVGLIHMNGRMYDAHLSRFLSPDNYVQAPYNTQSYNRYGYAFNNPLIGVDPSGEILWFIPVIGAIISGTVGYIAGKKVGLSGADLFAYTFSSAVIGAVSGGVGASVGTGVSAALSFGGFAGSFVAGAAGGAAGGFIGGLYSTALNNATFGTNHNVLLGGLKGAGVGALVGGLVGETLSGIDAIKSDASFWNGKYNGGEVGGMGESDWDAKFLDEQVPAGVKPTETGEIAVTKGNPN